MWIYLNAFLLSALKQKTSPDNARPVSPLAPRNTCPCGHSDQIQYSGSTHPVTYLPIQLCY